MPQTTINASFCNKIRPEIDAALAAVAAKYGLQSLKAGSMTYNTHEGNFTVKLEGNAAGCVTPRQSKEEANYFQERMYLPSLPELGVEVNVPRLGGLIKFIGKKGDAFGKEGGFLYTLGTKRFRVSAVFVRNHFKTVASAEARTVPV